MVRHVGGDRFQGWPNVRLGEIVYDVDIQEPAVVVAVRPGYVTVLLPSGWRMEQEEVGWLGAFRCACEEAAIQGRAEHWGK